MKVPLLSFLLVIAAICCHAQETINFRSQDVRLGYFYEVRQDDQYNRNLFVYKNRTDSLDQPVFSTDVNIYSAFHSPDGRFLVVNYGTASYGNVATVLDGEAPFKIVHISEKDYRNIIEGGLKAIYPNCSDGDLLHIYAPIRDIKNNKAILYASGDFVFNEADGSLRQDPFKGVSFGDNENRAYRSKFRLASLVSTLARSRRKLRLWGFCRKKRCSHQRSCDRNLRKSGGCSWK